MTAWRSDESIYISPHIFRGDVSMKKYLKTKPSWEEEVEMTALRSDENLYITSYIIWGDI